MVSKIGLVLLVTAMVMGCQRQPPEAIPPVDRTLPIDTVGDLAIYQLYCDNYDALPLQLKQYAYYLYLAGLSGRDIAYDQLAPKGLEIRRLLDDLARDEAPVNADFRIRLEAYAKRFWAFGGNYDPKTRRKFTPDFGPKELSDLMMREPKLGMRYGPAILADLGPFIFNAGFKPILVNKTPPDGGDPVASSAVNFYDSGITRPEVEGFQGEYALNSRLGLRDSKIVEQVYRAGDETVPPGRMAQALSSVISNLESALGYAPDSARPALLELIRYFRTGEPAAFERHQALWVGEKDCPVDYILGFVEVYDDPLGQRGAFEGMVMIEDETATRMMKTLAGDASWFEARMPWDGKYKKKEFTLPSARTFELLGGFGDGGPVCPVGINLPNFQKLRETVGTKNFLLTNVLETGDEARTRTLFDEFIAAKEEREQALAFYKPRQLAMIALHEVTGHGSGKVSPNLVGDPDKHLKEFASTLEEARADLVAHWFIGDPHLVELGVVPAGVTCEQEYAAMLTWSLIALRDVPEGDQFEEDHARAGHLIASYVIAKGGGELVREGGKSYVRLTDVETAHRAVGELLSEIMRIKATGDYGAARKLVETYGVKFDPNLRDEVVGRARSLGLHERSAFAMPELKLIQNKMGGVKGIQIVHPRDFKGQMLRFADH